MKTSLSRKKTVNNMGANEEGLIGTYMRMKMIIK